MTCAGSNPGMPTIPSRVAWLLVIISFVLVVIAAVLNHVIFSTTATVYIFPFFGGIYIDRGTLYDISLFLFIGAFVMVVVVLVLSVKRRPVVKFS